MPTKEQVLKSNIPLPSEITSSSWRNDLNKVRIIRLVLAVPVALVIAQLGNWPISFVTPVLVVALLEMPIAEPSLRTFMAYLSYALMSVVGVFVFVMLLQPYPLIFILGYTLVVFLSAYFMNKGAPLVLILLIVLALLILPIVGNVDEGLTAYLGSCMLLSELVAIVIIQLSHGLLPDPKGSEVSEPAKFQSGYSSQAASLAAVTTLSISPAMIIFLAFSWPAQLVVMIYVGLIALEGSHSHSVYDTRKYLAANTIAALTALVFYLVLVAVPELPMLVLLTLLVSLLFTCRRFSDAPDAKYYGSALIGVIIIISSSLGATADINKTILLRILYIFLAGMYVIAVTSIVEPFTRLKEAK